MKFQLRTKLSAALLLGLLPALGFIAFNLLRLEGLRQRVRELGGVKLVALRAAATATAMQHAVRVAPYRAMLGSETGNDSEMKAAGADARQFSAALRAAMDELAALPLGRDARDSAASARQAVTNYLARADELIALALAGQTAQTHETTPEFQAAFAQLQDRLGRLNTLLESEIRQNLAAAGELGSRSQPAVFVSALAGALFALVLAVPFARRFGGMPGRQVPPDFMNCAPHINAVVAAARCAGTTTRAKPPSMCAGREVEFVPLLDRRLADAAKGETIGADMELHEE